MIPIYQYLVIIGAAVSLLGFLCRVSYLDIIFFGGGYQLLTTSLFHGNGTNRVQSLHATFSLSATNRDRTHHQCRHYLQASSKREQEEAE